MSLELSTTQQRDQVLEVDVTGRLAREDYELFVPLVEERIAAHGKVSILFVMRDFHGWEAGALWEDLKFDVKHFNDIERLALVGEKRWQAGMAAFCRPFTTAKVRYFELEKLSEARNWVEGTD